MVNVMFFDIFLLVLFVIFISIFLYLKRENLKKEGLFFLYKTSWGIKLIDYIGKKYKKTLSFLSYVVIILGYFLMAGILYLLGKIVWIYLFNQNIVRAIKIPPIMPLVPYLPQLFKLDFLPPFYFTYWIIIIAIIAITHEIAHGIFAAHNNVKIKKTGFGFFPFFLPVLLAAFVELDEEVMVKKNKFSQMAILAAGTFANILTAILFFAIMWFFFSVSFIPSGVVFDTYASSIVGIAGITAVNGTILNNPTYEQILNSIDKEGFIQIKSEEKSYLATKDFLKKQEKNQGFLLLYDDAPAINAGLSGAIIEINGIRITNKEKLSEELSEYTPGEKIIVTSLLNDEIKKYDIILGEHPEKEGTAWLGVGFIGAQKEGLMSFLSSFKEPNVYYKEKFAGGSFIYNLLWWIALISLTVALINMLPVGIFDGGKFFYLTIWAITKNEKIAKKTFAFVTYLFLLVLFILMASWAWSFIG